MKYYKNTSNELFIDPIVKNHIGLIELSKEEFDAQLELNNTPSAEELVAITAAEFKQAKADALDSITVTTTNGNTFDGNETARGNMTSAILASEVIGKTEDTWKLADNSEVLVTITELKEALALSIQEVGRIVKVKSKDEL